MQAVSSLRPSIPVIQACASLGIPRASYYRSLRPPAEPRTRPASPRALTAAERGEVLGLLNSDRFVDLEPREIHAILLDEGRYLCSPRTMSRILEANAEVRERRDQLAHPAYSKPELLATRPNEVWSWDITKLLGPAKWTYYYLYVILDIFSRYVVGWMVAHREAAVLATRLIEAAAAKQNIRPEQLTIHADRGSPMKSKAVAQLLDDLGITKTHGRPHVSNDNPYSESQFKTLKYDPTFPDRFGSAQHARDQCRAFFPWYNAEHRHSGIGYLTPEVVHFGRAERVIENRRLVLDAAYATHPERFVRKPPEPPRLPTAAWINPPKEDHEPVPVLQ